MPNDAFQKMLNEIEDEIILEIDDPADFIAAEPPVTAAGRENAEANGASGLNASFALARQLYKPQQIQYSYQQLMEKACLRSNLLDQELAEIYKALVFEVNPNSRVRFSFLIPSGQSVTAAERSRQFLKNHFKTYQASALHFLEVPLPVFEQIKREVYVVRKLVRIEDSANHAETGETLYWDGQTPAEKEAARQAKQERAASAAVSSGSLLPGGRLDLTDLDDYRRKIEAINDGSLRLQSLKSNEAVKLILQDYTKSRGSDIYFQCNRDSGRVRYRRNNKVYTRWDHIPLDLYNIFINNVCQLARKDPSSMLHGPVGSIIPLLIKLDGEIKEVEYRFSSVPAMYLPALCLRGNSKPIKDIAKVGFYPDQLEQMESIYRQPRGILLVTGATGSGKTNTLESVFHILEEPDDKNITEIGNPIEIESKKRLQISLRPSSLQKEEDVLMQQIFKEELRQKPDILAFTEMRDKELAKIALDAAITGHLIFTTMHSFDVEETFTRLRQMNLDSDLLAKGIVGICSQTLIQKLCPHCRQDDVEGGARYGVEKIYRANDAGCENCEKGYAGMTAIAEVLPIPPDNAELKKWIIEGKKDHEIVELAAERGYMVRMQQIAERKIADGTTSELIVSKLFKLKPEQNVDDIIVGLPDDEDSISFYRRHESPILDAEFEDLAAN